MKKTFKRETANALLIGHWLLILGSLVLMYHRPDLSGSLVTLITSLSFPVYGFAMAAYGVDAAAKQIIPTLKGRGGC